MWVSQYDYNYCAWPTSMGAHFQTTWEESVAQNDILIRAKVNKLMSFALGVVK